MEAFITEKSKDYSLLDNRTGEILEYRQTKKVSLSEFIMVFFASYTEFHDNQKKEDKDRTSAIKSQYSNIKVIRWRIKDFRCLPKLRALLHEIT